MSLETAVFAGGCFWCTEAIFKRVRGVVSVISGYTGGQTKNPTYEEVCGGKSGHAEGIKIEFNPKLVDYKSLLEIFFATHDPTTLNRQGNDVGTQYRSEIFYSNEEQRIVAERYLEELKAGDKFNSPIVTALSELKNFYPAEDNHRDFYDQNRDYPYCRVIIDPKITKLLENFKERFEIKAHTTKPVNPE